MSLSVFYRMSNVRDAIASRRSSYPDQFMDKEIPKELIETLLESANCAPSHRKTYPWRFIVYRGQAKTDLGNFLAQTYKTITPEEKYSSFKHKKIAGKCLKSGAVIAVCMQRDLKERVPEWEEIAATAMAVQNVWLRLKEFGLGGYWSTPALKDYFKNFYELDEGQKCLGFFYLGFLEESITGQHDRAVLAQNIHFLD